MKKGEDGEREVGKGMEGGGTNILSDATLEGIVREHLFDTSLLRKLFQNGPLTL